MIVVFRVDSSTEIGSGHLIRCLTLAHFFKSRGASAIFICRDHPGNLAGKVEESGFILRMLPGYSACANSESRLAHASWLGADWRLDAAQTLAAIKSMSIPSSSWLVVDHYAIDYVWQAHLKQYCQKLMVMDDLADRQHLCDVLLDQNYGHVFEQYQNLVPAQCTRFVGAEFAFLREEFLALRQQALAKRTKKFPVKNILISLGWMDPHNVTSRIILALEQIQNFNVTVTVVVGRASPHFNTIEQLIQRSPLEIKLISETNKMAKLIVEADLAIGAAGVSALERCYLGLPSLIVLMALNQNVVADKLATLGACRVLGAYQALWDQQLIETVNTLRENTAERFAVSQAGFSVPVCKKVNEFFEVFFAITLRSATEDDCERVYAWQISEGVRKYSLNPAKPTFEEHSRWFAESLKDQNRYLNIIMQGDCPVGVLRLDFNTQTKRYVISILVSPAHQNQGVAKKSLKLAQQQFDQYRYSRKCYQKIKPPTDYLQPVVLKK